MACKGFKQENTRKSQHPILGEVGCVDKTNGAQNQENVISSSPPLSTLVEVFEQH